MAFGLILSARKKEKNKILFGLFLASSMIIFYFFLYESGLLNKLYALSAFCLSGGYLIGPMLFFLVSYAVDNNHKLRKIDLFHFIPAVLLMLITPILSKKYGHEDLSVYIFFFENRINLGIAFINDLSFSVYLFLTGRMLVKKYLWNLNALKKEPIALASMLVFSIICICGITDIITLLTGRLIFLQLTILFMCTNIISLFLLNLIYPNFENKINEIVIKQKERISYLSNVDQDHLERKLNEILFVKELFIDEDLSLKKLAAMTNVSTHQLSEFINVNYNKNYSHFINEFRIEKAKKLLIEKPEYTVLAIGFEVGFKSKSSFNDAFLKIANTTPSEYRNQFR
jgi:AraC-like DNA-binding protein